MLRASFSSAHFMSRYPPLLKRALSEPQPLIVALEYSLPYLLFGHPFPIALSLAHRSVALNYLVLHKFIAEWPSLSLVDSAILGEWTQFL